MISTRRFTRQDFDLVREFYERAFDGDIERKETAFKWLQSCNPFEDEANNYVLIFSDGRLVGYWGLMPAQLYFFGKPFLGLFSHETLVDPNYRKQGVATKLLKELNGSGHFLISLWHNEKILAIKEKAGWINVGNYRPLKKIYSLENLLRLKFRNQLLRKTIIHFLRPYYGIRWPRSKIQNNYSIEFITQCSNEFDHFFMEVAPKLGILSDRTAATLNWKYTDIPYKEYMFLAARTEGRICAYVVLRIEEQIYDIRKGIIVDLLCDPDEPEPLLRLVEKCDEIFSENKVDFSVCIVQPKIFRNVLKKNGYYEAQSKGTDSLWVYNENTSPNKAVIRNMSNWYFTYGDSDGDMW